jgi:hypothetical protein
MFGGEGRVGGSDRGQRSVGICASLVALWAFSGGNVGAASPASLQLPTTVTLVRESGSNKPITLEMSKSTPTKVSITPRSPQCIDSAFGMPGQAWHVDLSVGGITFQASKKMGVITPAQRATQLNLNSVESSAASNADVTVLVIDDFQPTAIVLDEGTPGLSPPKTWMLNHGALVVTHLETVLEAGNFVRQGQTGSPGPQVFKRGNRTIHVVTVDYGTLRRPGPSGVGLVHTDDLAATLNKVATDFNSKYLIINMSFSMLPCDIMQAYQELKAKAASHGLRYPLNQYLSSLEKQNWPGNSTGNHSQLEAQLTQIDAHNPFRHWLTQRETSHMTLPVASGGNYGYTFQTMPAAWSDVIGVGARSSIESSKAMWSDTSDVIEVGEWFKPFPPQPKLVNFAYRGTSFSAPSVAAAFATRIGRPGCFPSTSTGNWPSVAKKGNLPFDSFFSLKCH